MNSKRMKKLIIVSLLIATLLSYFGFLTASLTTFAAEQTDAPTKELKVLVISIDPDIKNPTVNDGSSVFYGIDTLSASQYLGYNLQKSVRSLKQDIEQGSNGSVSIKIVDTIYLKEFPSYVGFDSMTESQFLELFPPDRTGKGQWYGWWTRNSESNIIPTELDSGFHFDYNYLVEKCNLVSLRNAGKFDMVWVYGLDPLSMYETAMIGRNPFWVNGAAVEADCDNFVIGGFTFSRSDGALESFCHLCESMLNYTYGISDYEYNKTMEFQDLSELNTWQKFYLCKHKSPANNTVYGVGQVHFAPNSTSDYEWNSNTPVSSYFNEFETSYPDITVTSATTFTADVYLSLDSTPGIAHHIWWLQHMPHYSGRDENGYSHNWWDYIITCDPTVGLCFHDGTDTKELVLDKDYSTSDISFTVKLKSGKTKTINLLDTTFYTEGKGKISIDNGTIKVLKPGNEKIEIFYDGYHVQLLIHIPCNHADTIEVDGINADCEKAGYTSGTYCRDCEEYILGHEEIMPHHEYEILKNQNEICSIKCKRCGYECKALYISEEKECGDTIKFGSYEQNNLLSDGKEEIEWLVLDKTEDKYLLLSKYCLASLPYNNEFISVGWQECSLRKWLNTDFLKTAFTDVEQEVIRQTNGDTVFLPGINEIDKYFKTEQDRLAKVSEYAIANGAWNAGGYCCWWLMQNTDSMYAPIVDAYGPVFTPGNPVIYEDGVRPMIWINYYKEPEYAVEVINGTGTGEYQAGDTVSITAGQKEGYKFIKWEVTSGNIDLASSTKDTTSFTMVAEDVKIEALYEAISYSVKAKSSKNGITMVNKSSATVGEQLTFLAMPKKGYRLKEWIVLEGNAEIISENKNSIKIKMPANNVIVEAVYEAISY